MVCYSHRLETLKVALGLNILGCFILNVLKLAHLSVAQLGFKIRMEAG